MNTRQWRNLTRGDSLRHEMQTANMPQPASGPCWCGSFFLSSVRAARADMQMPVNVVEREGAKHPARAWYFDRRLFGCVCMCVCVHFGAQNVTFMHNKSTDVVEVLACVRTPAPQCDRRLFFCGKYRTCRGAQVSRSSVATVCSLMVFGFGRSHRRLCFSMGVFILLFIYSIFQII